MKNHTPSQYFIRSKDNRLWNFYYDLEQGVCCKVYADQHWSSASQILSNAKSNFSITLDDDNKIYLFCQDITGNIVLCLYDGASWSSQIVLENQSKTVYTIYFHAIINETGLHLFYNLPDEESGNQFLIHQSRGMDGKWGSPTKIDLISPLSSAPFYIQKVNSHHILIFYQTKYKEYNIGYREFSLRLKKWSEYHIFYTSVYQCLDQSFLTTSKDIHALYVIRGMYSYQLIYRKKQDSGWSNPITLWESQKIDICSLLMVQDELFAVWITNRQYYTCSSKNRGQNFSKPTRNRSNLSREPIKAFYQSSILQNEKDIYLHDVLVKDPDQMELLLIPELYPEFYPRAMKTASPKSQVEEHPQRVPIDEDANENMLKLRNQVSLYKKQSDEKDQQIYQLTQRFAHKNEELSELRAEIQNLKALHQSLLQKSQALEEASAPNPDPISIEAYNLLLQEKQLLEKKMDSLSGENEALKKTKMILEEKISEQSIEISTLQNLLDSPKDTPSDSIDE